MAELIRDTISAGTTNTDAGTNAGTNAGPSRGANPVRADVSSAVTIAVPTGQVVAALSSTQKATSVAGSRLTDKGLLYAPEHGYVAFTVSGMAAYLNRQDPAIHPPRRR